MYFVTICTKNRDCFFGDIAPTAQNIPGETEYQMNLSNLGKVVEAEWIKTIELRPDMNLELAEHVVMPNHFHGIIIIGNNPYNTLAHDKNKMRRISTPINDAPKNKFSPQAKNLASIIRGFKSAVTTHARKNEIPFDWQARFHDHIIISNDEYLRIGDYIINNVQNWEKDKFYK